MTQQCNCRATKHILSPEEMQWNKESFERAFFAKPQMDIEFCPLHAAAPDLLAALKEILYEAEDADESVNPYTVCEAIEKQARAAIAKAEEES